MCHGLDPGILILTDRGERALRDLGPGDRVITRDNGPCTVLWSGPGPDAALVRLADPVHADAPVRPIALGPRHRVLFRSPALQLDLGLDEALVPAAALAAADGRPRPTWGLALDRHALIQAGGHWVESLFAPDHPGLAPLPLPGHRRTVRPCLTLAEGLYLTSARARRRAAA